MTKARQLTGGAFALALLTSAALLPTAARAQDAPFAVTGGVTIGTDYVFRGISQTDEDPTIQGSIGIESETGLFASVWAANVDFNDGDEAHIEIDYTIGYGNAVGDLEYTAMFIYYTYPGAAGSLDYDYWEAGLSMSYALGPVSPTVSAYYADNFFADTGEAFYLTGGLSFAASEMVSVYGNIGKQWYDDAALTDAVDWNVGATLSAFDLDFDLKYTGNDDDGLGDLTDDRIVLSVSKSF